MKRVVSSNLISAGHEYDCERREGCEARGEFKFNVFRWEVAAVQIVELKSSGTQCKLNFCNFFYELKI